MGIDVLLTLKRLDIAQGRGLDDGTVYAQSIDKNTDHGLRQCLTIADECPREIRGDTDWMNDERRLAAVDPLGSLLPIECHELGSQLLNRDNGIMTDIFSSRSMISKLIWRVVFQTSISPGPRTAFLLSIVKCSRPESTSWTANMSWPSRLSALFRTAPHGSQMQFTSCKLPTECCKILASMPSFVGLLKVHEPYTASSFCRQASYWSFAS